MSHAASAWLSDSDEKAVQNLLSAYVLCLDVGDVDGAMDLFTEGGEFRVYGRVYAGDKLRAMFEAAPKGQHLTGRALVTAGPDGATVRSQLVFFPADRSAHRLTIYDDVVVPTGDRWLFRSRDVRFMDTDGGLRDRP